MHYNIRTDQYDQCNRTNDKNARSALCKRGINECRPWARFPDQGTDSWRLAAVRYRHSVGLDLLMTKYRNDYKAEQRLRAAINEWVHQRPHPERATAACQLALSIVLERNLPAQVAYITALLRRYGPRAAQNSTVKHSRYAFVLCMEGPLMNHGRHSSV